LKSSGEHSQREEKNEKILEERRTNPSMGENQNGRVVKKEMGPGAQFIS
jgi:hypothetical protein